jgi:hypothetical protein
MTTAAEVARSRAQSALRADAAGPGTPAPATTITAAQRPGSAVLQISATSGTRARALSAAVAAQSAVRRYLDGVQPLYRVGGVPGAGAVVVKNGPAAWARFALACGLGAAAGALVVAGVYALRARRVGPASQP